MKWCWNWRGTVCLMLLPLKPHTQNLDNTKNYSLVLTSSSSTLKSWSQKRKMLTITMPMDTTPLSRRSLIFSWIEFRNSWPMHKSSGLLGFQQLWLGNWFWIHLLADWRTFSVDYGKNSKLGFSIYPTPQVSTAVSVP